MLSDQLGHPSEWWHKASTDHHICVPIKGKWNVCFTDARFAYPSVLGRIISREMIFITLSLDHFSPISTSASYIHRTGQLCFQFIRWHTKPTLILLFLLLSGSGWNINALRLTTGNSKSHLFSRHWCHKVVHLCSETDPSKAMSKRDSLITIVISFAIRLFPWVLWKRKYAAEEACWKYLQWEPKLLPCLSESLLHEAGLLICPSSGTT